MADGSGYPPPSGSLGDLTTEAGLTQATYELDRAELAGTEAAMSEWARRWGRLATEAFRHNDSTAEALEAAEDEATKFEKALSDAADKAETICKLVEGEDGPIFDRVFSLAEEIQELAA